MAAFPIQDGRFPQPNRPISPIQHGRFPQSNMDDFPNPTWTISPIQHGRFQDAQNYEEMSSVLVSTYLSLLFFLKFPHPELAIANQYIQLLVKCFPQIQKQVNNISLSFFLSLSLLSPEVAFKIFTARLGLTVQISQINIFKITLINFALSLEKVEKIHANGLKISQNSLK